MVQIPIENKIVSVNNTLEDLLTDLSHMVGEVDEKDEATMEEISDRVYEAYQVMAVLKEKYIS